MFNDLVITAAAALAVCAVLFMLVKWAVRRHERRVLPHVLEILVLLVGMLLLAVWMPPDIRGMRYLDTNLSMPDLDEFESVAVTALVFGLFFIPILLLVRFVPARLPVLLGSFAWVGLLMVGLYQWKTVPVIEQIRKDDTVGLLSKTLLVGTWALLFRVLLWAVVTVLIALYAVRRRFSYGRLIAAAWAGGIIAGLLMSPFAMWSRWYLLPLGFGAFAALLVSLPLQRAGLERLLGIRLGRGPAAPPLPYSPWASFAGHAALVVLGVSMACSAAVNYAERVQYGTVMEGPPPVWRSPGHQNAFESLKLYFRKGEGYPQVTAANPPKDYILAQHFLEQISSGTRENAYAKLNRAEWDAYFARMGGFIRPFEAATQADYLQLPGKTYLSFLNLRETARAIGIRAHLALRDNRPQEAANDIRTLFAMGGLLHDQPILVTQMIGVAIRNYSTNAAWNFVAAAHGNADALNHIAAVLAEMIPIGRANLNYTALKLGEFPTGPILPNVEIMVPAFARAHKNTMVSWMNFDLLTIATALERFRLAEGKYPGALAELAPTYLQRIPRDPIEGREYSYVPLPDGSYELKNLAYPAKWEEEYAKPLHVPPMTAPDAETSAPFKTKAGKFVVDRSR